jgi:DAK2 domain fusion protein YloV
LEALLQAAKTSLDKTPEILPVLKQAGVVDAGGMGVVTLLEGAVLALKGEAVSLQQGVETPQATESKLTAVSGEEIKFLYCTEFLIQKAPERKTTQFRAAIQPKGDCMLVIEDDEVVKVHIHTNNPGYVIEQALKLGELTNLKIDNMKYQHEEKIQTDEGVAPSQRKKYGVVTVSAGAGLSEVFVGIGADAVVEGGQTMNPSTQDLLDAVQRIGAETVFILPNNKNIILAAEQVNELADCSVVVIPTKNIPQGISALLAFSEDADVDENREAMCEMMNAVQCGQVTFAARNSTVDGMKIKKDDIMGMVGSSIRKLGKDVNQVAEELVDSLITDESGMISIYYGADTDEATAKQLEKALAEKYSYLDVSLVYGGQPVYYYFLAVE